MDMGAAPHNIAPLPPGTVVRQQVERPAPLDHLANKPPAKVAENWVEAKNIYNNTLHDVLIPLVYETMYGVYKDAENLTPSKNQGEKKKPSPL